MTKVPCVCKYTVKISFRFRETPNKDLIMSTRANYLVPNMRSNGRTLTI